MKLSLKDLDVKDKKVLMRVDFNVPLDSDSKIVDATKIETSLPSIQYVLDQGGTLILMSHLGRPRGAYRKELSLAPVRQILSELLRRPVLFAEELGHVAQEMASNLKTGEILLLENLRFHTAEEHPDKDEDFAKYLALLGDAYVNEAFACSHRKHSSIYDLPQLFPGKSALGFLIEKEIEALTKILKDPQRPFYAILGGAKVSTKMGVLESILKKADLVMIGGAMALTFLKAQNKEVGASFVENDLTPFAKEILGKFERKILLPVDFLAAKEMSATIPVQTITLNGGIPQDLQAFDIGPKTQEIFTSKIKEAKTILWNGPLGVYEIDAFDKGTKAIATAIAASDGLSVVGGGDTIAALHDLELEDKITHISTGGGATLEFIEFGTLPGIDVVSNTILA